MYLVAGGTGCKVGDCVATLLCSFFGVRFALEVSSAGGTEASCCEHTGAVYTVALLGDPFLGPFLWTKLHG